MKLNAVLMIVALVAVVVALFAWAVAKTQNASDPRRQTIGNANRKFFRRHMRKVYLAPLLIQRMFGFLPGQREPHGGVCFANIGDGAYPHGVKSYLPDAATTARYLIYKIGTDADHVALAGAGDVPVGQSDDSADVGIPIAINLFGSKAGTLRVVTDGTIANGDYVKTAANGTCTKASTTDAGQFGKALFGTDCSSAAGDVITVVTDVPSKVSF